MKIGENNQQKWFPKFPKEVLIKKRNICEIMIIDEYVYTISNFCYKKRQTYATLNSPKRPFYAIYQDLDVFPDFRILSDLDRSKSVLGSFCVLDENLT